MHSHVLKCYRRRIFQNQCCKTLAWLIQLLLALVSEWVCVCQINNEGYVEVFVLYTWSDDREQVAVVKVKTSDFVPADLRKTILIVVIRLTSLKNGDAYNVWSSGEPLHVSEYVALPTASGKAEKKCGKEIIGCSVGQAFCIVGTTSSSGWMTGLQSLNLASTLKPSF